MAAFISGLTGTSDAAGIGANFTSALAARLEDASLQDQSLACANLATVLAHLYTCSLLPATTVYSFLDHLTHRCVLITCYSSPGACSSSPRARKMALDTGFWLLQECIQEAD